MDKKGNNFAYCSTENECRNLVFLLVLTSRVELFVKKCNCRNLSLIQDAGETTRRRNDRKPSMCGEPAWLAELASLTSDPFLAGKPLVAWRNVSGYNDLQREKSKKVS